MLYVNYAEECVRTSSEFAVPLKKQSLLLFSHYLICLDFLFPTAEERLVTALVQAGVRGGVDGCVICGLID